MNKLSNWLQTNPSVVLAMFTISLASGLATLLLGWNQLYKDYLSKTAQLPVWLILIILVLAISVAAYKKSPVNDLIPRELTKVEGQRFGVQRVTLDGYAFERCEFHGSEIVFDGSSAFSLCNCKFSDIRFTFSGGATMTLEVLTQLYQDQAFRPLVERTVENIRSGSHPEAVPPREMR